VSEHIVDTRCGSVRGREREGHVVFMGVRYGAPAGGGRRFTAPEAPEPWTGVVDAFEPGNVAPQDPLVGPPYRAEGPEDEDCLFLNVFTPAPDGRRRPVLFWIHGGGFSHGAGSQVQYDGGPLAERGDIVVVTINYRVGALGYLYLGAHGGTEWGATANAGQLDQVLALRWVRDNIAAFGGDPGNVTIAGQSAGSVAVGTLLAMPAARGLFHRAIAQSGTASRLGQTEQAAAATASYLERLGIPDADPEALRRVAVADLLAAQGQRGVLSPVVDGTIVPEHPVTVVRQGAAADIPLLIGTTRDEQKLYVAGRRPEIDDAELERQVRRLLPRRAAERTAEVIALYRSSRSTRQLGTSNHDIVDAVTTASRHRMPTLRLAEAHRAHQPATFLYQFDWESPARGGSLGACHGLDIPFVFGTIGRNGDDRMSGSGEAALRLSAQMMDAWIGFVTHGDPSHPGIGAWPAYDAAERWTMVFGPETAARQAPFEEERALWDSLIGGTAPAGQRA
jgi:para-nitrobenzyl esterase